MKSQATEPKVEEVFVPKSEDEEYAVEPAKSKLFGRKITTDKLENAAGKVVGKAQKGVESIAEDLKRRGREKAAIEKEMKDAYNETFTKARIEAIRDSARSAGRRTAVGGYGGYSLSRQPTKVARTMKPPAHRDLPDGDMGMSIGGTSLISSLSGLGTGGRKEPTQYRMSSGQPVGRIQVRGTNPVNDNRSENLVRLGNTGIPIGNMRMISGAGNLVSLGVVNSPVNVDVSNVSTRISKGAKPETKFKGRRPRTETRKPDIRTKVVTEKKFWEL